MADITSISGFCAERNLSGYKTLLYVPVHWLDEVDYTEIISGTGNFQKAISPTQGGQAWLTLPFLPGRNDGWQEAEQKTLFGSEYRQQVSGTIPKLRPEVTTVLESMSSMLFIVRLTDANGKTWLIGRKTEPLEFVATADTSGKGGGVGGYSFSFQGSTSRRAFGYAPVF